ncbi:response regulator transcription factor [Mycobacterium sp. 852002-51961_SCH5331710]|uniref:LuxR C-terminal-related transcriptional regulator n=1 Tax=Mycobacterium sp. 852002-51961_SCH5331710 TaxID=1834105 RepID=UPI0007FD0C09|nr:response regulator transcription factor [Mycobacterium sp. 852002-51961_SCH5331710]OBB44637.1 DNA-binding response regulator [Mycobacterium sp. 852002-51961_SCH5331710]
MNNNSGSAVISAPTGGLRTTRTDGPGFERSAEPAESVCAPITSGGWSGASDRQFDSPRTAGWDAHIRNGDGTEHVRDHADRPGALRDAGILIVDDNTLYRDFVAGVVAAQGVVNPGVAWDLPSLVWAIENTMPRVILLSMATRDSEMLLRQALKLNPSVRVIVLGMTEDDEQEIVSCAEAGAAGYHLRSDSLDDLLLLIRKVAAGESMCSPRVSAILLRRLSEVASQRQSPDKELVLTAREVQILKMLELGLSNKDIAQELCIALHTVKNHVHNLLTKLGVSSRTHAAALSRTLRYTEG